MRLILLLTSFLFLQAQAQVYQFHFFGRDVGLPQPFVYTINQTTDGFLWVGTGEGLSSFDGRQFKTFTVDDGLAEDFVTTSYVDKQGNLWLGHNQGGLTYYNGKKFHIVHAGGSDGSTITDIREDPYGNVWASTKGAGLLKMDKKDGLHVFKKPFREHIIYALEVTSHELLVATSFGLLTYQYGKEKGPILSGSITAFDGLQINFIGRRPYSDKYWICTDKSGLYELSVRSGEDGANRYSVAKVAENFGLDSFNIIHIAEDSYQNLWLSTFGNGMLQLMNSGGQGYSDMIRIDRSQGFAGDFIKGTFEDRERNIWVATYGNGLAMRTNDYFSFYPLDKEQPKVTAVDVTNRGLWTGGSGKITFFNPLGREQNKTYELFDEQVEITTVFEDKNGNVIAGTAGKGIYVKRAGNETFSREFSPTDILSRHITSIIPIGSEYYVSTHGGIYHLSQNMKVLKQYTTLNGLLHNTVYDLDKDPEGKVWLANQAPEVQVIDRKDGSVNTHELHNAELLVQMNGVESTDEGTWVSTYGNGIFLIRKDTILQFDTRIGLSSNYCYGLVVDTRGYVWALHRNTLSRIGRADQKIRIYAPGGSVYQDLGFRSGACDKFGNIWFATEKGLLRYSPDRDKPNSIPPLLRLRNIYADELLIPQNVDAPKLDYNTFKIRFDLQGLSLRNPENLLYRYKLEGYDREWSELTDENLISYTRLPDGEYTFLAEAKNADGVVTASPLRVNFTVQKPYWKKWWFALGLIALVGQSSFLFIRYRERRHRKIKQMLKQMLDERTQVVLAQKEELEKKNKDITDSISYARRIQWSILPDIQELKKVYPEAFILYKPKDIVSGDFYWMKRFGGKFLIACADATGHGVPGAFMSLIGSTLLKDITELGNVSDPASVLTSLDYQVRSILSMQGEGSANDGMDMSLCEFDKEQATLSFSLAMRPLVLIRDGQHTMYRGDRKPIGGIKSTEENYTNHSISLQKDDMIYLFTDGFHDQFGGSKSKKLKLRPFLKMLEQVSWLPVEKQQLLLERKFHHWKGDQEQVDDVLVIGIRF